MAGEVILYGKNAAGKLVPLKLNNDGTLSGAGVSDHGALTGLSDNDHPQYELAADLHPVAESGDYNDLSNKPATGAPADGTYLVTTAHAGLSAEVAVGATPGGELGGTWPSPTVDAVHSGSSHAATQTAAEATAATALSAHVAAADPHTQYALESALASVATSGSYNDLSNKPTDGVSEPLIILEDQKAQNTAGGTFTQGAWQTRTLNTEVVDTHNLCTLSANQFTLPAGTYRLEAKVPAYAVGHHQARLRDITNGATLKTGTSEFAYRPNFAQTSSVINARFTLAGSTVLEIQHECEVTGATDGFGQADNFGTEVYTTVKIYKEILAA